ncbi:hypothetical protein GCM10009092_15630 [Bowmanella denitrificans]|uniref:Uncharacterized protein n=1 Tax=Bowmanella denitrificans TaxID=366582 RepID=A0ABN0X0N4_9ALTE
MKNFNAGILAFNCIMLFIFYLAPSSGASEMSLWLNMTSDEYDYLLSDSKSHKEGEVTLLVERKPRGKLSYLPVYTFFSLDSSGNEISSFVFSTESCEVSKSESVEFLDFYGYGNDIFILASLDFIPHVLHLNFTAKEVQCKNIEKVSGLGSARSIFITEDNEYFVLGMSDTLSQHYPVLLSEKGEDKLQSIRSKFPVLLQSRAVRATLLDSEILLFFNTKDLNNLHAPAQTFFVVLDKNFQLKGKLKELDNKGVYQFLSNHNFTSLSDFELLDNFNVPREHKRQSINRIVDFMFRMGTFGFVDEFVPCIIKDGNANIYLFQPSYQDTYLDRGRSQSLVYSEILGVQGEAPLVSTCKVVALSKGKGNIVFFNEVVADPATGGRTSKSVIRGYKVGH